MIEPNDFFSQCVAFIGCIRVLCNDERRGKAAKAALRRGLASRDGWSAEMSQYIESCLPDNVGLRQHRAYYLIASLYALHEASTDQGDLGNHLAALAVQDENRQDSLSKHLTALLGAHRDDLGYHLRHVVRLLAANEVAVNWPRLLADVLILIGDRESSADEVRKRWARHFWGNVHDSQNYLDDVSRPIATQFPIQS